MRAAVVVALVLLCDAAVQAQPAPAPPVSPFDAGAVSVEFDAGVLVEAWNLNREREWLLDVTGSVWWAFQDNVAVGAEFRHTRVYQETPNAFVQGFSPLFRWRFLRRDAWSMFMEVGPGISWSDIETPPLGTKFNYLFQGSGGAMWRVGGNVHAVAAFRFLHVSNNGREGQPHNPDIEGMGGLGGITVTF
jgi:Lipid A 3-O-deacylase (PagL)